MKNLLVTLLCITLISCTPEVLDKTEPLSIAKTILIAYKAKDLKTLSSFTYAQSENSAHKKLLNEMIEQGDKHPKYNFLWKGWRMDAVNNWDGNSLEVIREDSIGSKNRRSRVKFGESEISISGTEKTIEDYVVTLDWKDGAWYFQDIHSPSRAIEN